MKRIQLWFQKLKFKLMLDESPFLWADATFLILQIFAFIYGKAGYLIVLEPLSKLLVGFPLMDRSLWEKAYSDKYDWGCKNPDDIKKMRDPYKGTIIIRIIWVVHGLTELILLL